MTIRTEPTIESNGRKNRDRVQLYAAFDFDVLTGVMRFLAPVGGSGCISGTASVGSKRERDEEAVEDEAKQEEENEEEHGEDYDEVAGRKHQSKEENPDEDAGDAGGKLGR